MKIDHIHIQNFKGFADKSLHFHPQMTVLIGDNGTGKTSILDALAFVSGTFFLGVDGVASRPLHQVEKRRKVCSPGSNEIQLPFRVDVHHSLNSVDYQWYRSAHKVGGGADWKHAEVLINQVKQLTTQVRAGESVQLPLIAYYGTERFSVEKVRKPSYAKNGSRLDGYDNALNPRSSKLKFLNWFKTFEDSVLKFNKDKTLYQAFTNAIISMVPHWENIHFDWESDDMLGQLENGEWMALGNLSDGYQNIVHLSADIAHRAITLNPQLGENAVADTEGIVLIDELDMHLHPKWQKNVVNDFKRTFPKIQFIVTTHSPFIVQSLLADETVNLDEEVLSNDPLNRTLEENALFMGVEDHRSARFARKHEKSEQYLKILESGNQDEDAILILDQILEEFSDDPAFVAELKLKRIAKLGSL